MKGISGCLRVNKEYIKLFGLRVATYCAILSDQSFPFEWFQLDRAFVVNAYGISKCIQRSIEKTLVESNLIEVSVGDNYVEVRFVKETWDGVNEKILGDENE